MRLALAAEPETLIVDEPVKPLGLEVINALNIALQCCERAVLRVTLRRGDFWRDESGRPGIHPRQHCGLPQRGFNP
jgi:hypothetical protein